MTEDTFVPADPRRVTELVQEASLSMGSRSRVSSEDLVLVLLGVRLKRSVPTETLQTNPGGQ